MKHLLRVAALAAFVSSAAPPAARAAFTMDDIHFWVGEGTNAAVVVVDWGRTDASAVRAWGYHWDGAATAADALLALDAADPRLDVGRSISSYGLYLTNFTYRAPGGETYEAAAEDYYDDSGSTGTYWSISAAAPGCEMEVSGSGASSLALVPGGRLGLKWTYYTYNYATFDYDGGDPSVAEDAAVAAPAPPFTMDDIHFWVGSGTNRAAFVVDFGLDGYFPRAWGFRWNAPTNLAELVAAVAHEDPRLGFYADPTQADTFAAAFSYDAGDAAASFDLDSGTTTDPDAWFAVPRATSEGSVTHGQFWNIVKGSGETFDEVSVWSDTTGMDAETLADGTWYLFRLNWYTWDAETWAYEQGDPETRRPRSAESPYGWRVTAASLNPADPYSRTNAVLGRPTVDAPASSWNGRAYPPSPIHPGSPAARPIDIVALSSPDEEHGVLGSVMIEFDHPVVDDPRNPFGLDFIVFGNALQVLGGNAEVLGTDNPATVVFTTDSVPDEGAVVSVSQDGEAWFSFTNGPFADAFAPTLGRLYDPARPDPALFAGTDFTNRFWGRPAHATIPVDPAVSAKDFKGRTLADYAKLYNGSAGGTGFDISAFDLPRDARGRKWIRFVRVTAPEAADTYQASPEIDAVADVAPAPSFRNWVDANFPFAERPGVTKATVCANGEPAFVNAALGLAPDAPAPGAWAIEGFDPATRTLAAPLAPQASELVRLRSATAPTNAAWSASLPLWTGTNALGRPLLRVQDPATAGAPAAFFRLELHD